MNMLKWGYLEVIISVWKSTDSHSIIIKSKESGLVFDGNEEIIRAEKPNNSTGQRWILEATPKGYFIIKNAKNGYALDVQFGCQYSNIIVFRKHAGINQQFFIHSDGTIGTACGEQFILKMENGTVLMNNIEETCAIKDTVFQIEETNQ